MGEAMAVTQAESAGIRKIHPLTIRWTHWINVFAMLLMVASGWRIYNAAPLFAFKFPIELTIGGWLGGALQWHFAAMWLLVANGAVYVAYGLWTRYFRSNFLPLTPQMLWRDCKMAMRGKISHQPGVYNAVQRAAYLGVIGLLLVLVASGLAIWKPVQFQVMAALMGGYEGARLVHFLAMVMTLVFITVHVVMVILVPRTLRSMLGGRMGSDANEGGLQ